MDFKDIVNSRYATKEFDSEKIIEEDKLNELFELIRLSPSSFNIQPWKIKVVSDKETKEKLLPATYNQPQVSTCSHVLVFCVNTDINELTDRLENHVVKAGTPEEKAKGVTDMIKGMVSNFDDHKKTSWVQRQVYIALGNALNGSKYLGFDSCPIEGFQPEEYSKILGLPNNLVPTVVVTIGHGVDTPKPKIRFPKEEVFF